MKRLILTIMVAALLVSFNPGPENAVRPEMAGVNEFPVPWLPQDKTFEVEAAYVKYKSTAAGQEMIREWWFDRYGDRQYEENYMYIMDQKFGGKSLVLDGYQYQWDYDATEGTKRRFHQSETNYENISERDIERYGIQKHGYEDILGKKCLKVTTEKPVKSTIWVWKGIPVKTEATFASQKVVSEAIEISTDNIDPSVFSLPDGVSFSEPE